MLGAWTIHFVMRNCSYYKQIVVFIVLISTSAYPAFCYIGIQVTVTLNIPQIASIFLVKLCMRACVRVCMRVRVYVCARACVCVCM